MGVIKRFAISSMVLGTLAMLGGASALAFGGETQPAQAPAAGEQTSVSSDVPADAPAVWGWIAPHNIPHAGE